MEGAFWYGLAVHVRIYPIIYALPILLFLNHHHPSSTPSQPKTPQPPTDPIPQPRILGDSGWAGGWEWGKRWFVGVLTQERVVFGIVSGTTFTAFTLFFFWLYGWTFLNEALLYHLTRADPRHNFSIYFYQIYLVRRGVMLRAFVITMGGPVMCMYLSHHTSRRRSSCDLTT